VARHEEAIGKMREEMAQHPANCDVRADLAALQQTVAAEQAADNATARWWDRMMPAIWFLVGCIAALILRDGGAILKLMKG
jgi:hypothetical protein